MSSPRFTRSAHLVDLVAEVERLAALVGTADPDARERLAADRRDQVVRATLVLDGAAGEALPDVAAATALLGARTEGAVDPVARPPAGWFDTLRVLDDPDDEVLRALEVVGAARALAADDLTDRLAADLPAALAALHDRLARGLVAPARVGAPRITEQAVHDGSVGRLLYATTQPPAIAGELALLGGWLATTGPREHALVSSGIVHLEVLRIHPFDAANGRLARAAARLLLRARGLDPNGLADPEPALAADPLGYHEEVARTLRRRDLTIWLERWAEAVSDGLRGAALALGLLTRAVPERATSFLAGRDEPAFTLADYRAQAPAAPEVARGDLAALLDAGRIRRHSGSRGLRFAVVTP
jgi:hypothetical protein